MLIMILSAQKILRISQMFESRNSNRMHVLNKFLEMSKKRKIIITSFNNDLKNSFNIFKDLSIDLKFNEINHSKMLRKIFSPDTNDIGDKEYLNIFVKLIEKIKGINLLNLFCNTFYVDREVGRKSEIKESGGIDIFIYNENYSIIIENKITQRAGDQDNQLARYYKISKELKKTPVAIIYIPFYYQDPPLNDYTEDYRKYINKIKELLVIIPAIDPINGNDLTHGFLDKCSEYAKNMKNYTACVCLDQYSKFIKSKGDVDKMAKNEDMKFIEKVFSDMELKQTIEDIVEIWGNRPNIIAEIFLEYLKTDLNFTIISGYCGKMIDDDVFIYFHNDYQIGFGSIKGKFNKIKSAGKNIITEKDNIINFSGEDAFWIYGKLKQELFNNNIIEMKKKFSDIIKMLEDEMREILKMSNFA